MTISAMKKTKTSEKVDNCRLGTQEGECGQESLTRKVTFEERLEGSEKVRLDDIGVMSIPE